MRLCKRAFKEGETAYRAAWIVARRSDPNAIPKPGTVKNPYRPLTTNWYSWNRGWNSAS